MERGKGVIRVNGGGGGEGGESVESLRLFSTFSIMTLAWFRLQLLNDNCPGEPFLFCVLQLEGGSSNVRGRMGERFGC